MYYLQSRYYNPNWGRFINADSLVSSGQGILGNNMFAYCRNNPVKRKDATGTDDVCVTQADDMNTPLNDLGYAPSGSGNGGGQISSPANSSSGGKGSTGYSYSATSGGGGATSSIQVGDTTVTFGHGGRHVGLSDISGLESAIANDVVARPPTTGTFLCGYISYGGADFTYRYFTLSNTRINVGTYYYTAAK